MAKLQTVSFKEQVKRAFVPIGTIALGDAPFFNLEHSFLQQCHRFGSPSLVSGQAAMVLPLFGLVVIKAGQEQLLLGLVKLEADPLPKGTAQGDVPGSHAAKISLGKAGCLTQPIPCVFEKYWMLLRHNLPPKGNGQ